MFIGSTGKVAAVPLTCSKRSWLFYSVAPSLSVQSSVHRVSGRLRALTNPHALGSIPYRSSRKFGGILHIPIEGRSSGGRQTCTTKKSVVHSLSLIQNKGMASNPSCFLKLLCLCSPSLSISFILASLGTTHLCFAPQKAEWFRVTSPRRTLPQLEPKAEPRLDLSQNLGRSEPNVNSLGSFWPSWGAHLLLGEVVN